MKRYIFAVAVFSTLASPAFAEMPNFDVNSHCAQMAHMGGANSEFMRNACLNQEQEAYNNVKPQWDKLSSQMRQHCLQMASIGTPSYFMLNACIDQEQEAAKQNKNFQFQR